MPAEIRRSRLATGGLLLATLMAGCGVRAIKSQSEQIEALGQVRGRVERTTAQTGPAYALLLVDDGTYLTVRARFPLTSRGEFAFFVRAGRYAVAAFVDASGDGEYQDGEPATYLGVEAGDPARIDVPPHGQVVVDPLVIAGTVDRNPALGAAEDLRKSAANVGRVVSLLDPIFSRSSASMGYWRPVDYIRQYGGGLFMLQEYEPGKTPVVFVHGAVGSAVDFEAVIASLDRNRYQPWVLQYPSGVRLDAVSSYLLSALDELHNRHRFDGIVLVAHSMGGLVARSFVMKHQQSGSPVRILLAMTVNSPLDGMRSAASGVAHSPIVVPSWRDVAHGSTFLLNIRSWPWPKEIPYYLVFSFKPGEGKDGVVPLESQLPPALQAEASEMRGFTAEHTGTLRDEAFLRYFGETLAHVPRA